MAKLEEFYPERQGRPKGEIVPYIRSKSIQAHMIADGALDYGLSFYARVTTAVSSTHFKASGLKGLGAGFFIPTAGAPYEIFVLQADAAAPEGQMTPVVAYDTSDGDFQHAAFTTNDLAVGDIVLILHPLIASLGTKAMAAATGAVTTTDYMMAYIKQLVTIMVSGTYGMSALKTLIDAVLAKTNNLPSDPADQSLIEAETGAIITVVNAILAKTNNLPSDPADQSLLGDALSVIWTYIQAVRAKTDNLPSDPADQSLIEAETGAIQTVVNAIKAKTDNLPSDPADESLLEAETGAIKTVVDAIKAVTDLLPDAGALDDLATILADTADMQPKLGTPAANLAADIAAIKTVVDAIPTTAMRGTDGAALASAWTAALAGVLANYTATRAGYLDELAAANLPTDVTALNTLLSDGTYGLAALETLVDEVEIYLKHGTYGLDALLTAIQAVSGGYTHTDWKGSFNWDTSAYTTVEQDISALFSTNLALTTRRKYSVKLDLTNVEQDASFVELYLAVKEKIDGTNYRAIDRKTVTKADIHADSEPGIVIDIPATSENIQITIKMSVALAGDATIYYAVVKEHLE